MKMKIERREYPEEIIQRILDEGDLCPDAQKLVELARDLEKEDLSLKDIVKDLKRWQRRK